jgi:NADH-quinone oxidoreductase subunit H
LSEYLNIILMSILIIILFFGGWLPLLGFSIFYTIPSVIWFSIKLFFMLFMFIWVRAVLPRFRYDQLMSLGWKVILPLAIVFLFQSIFLIYLFNGLCLLPFFSF